MQSEEDLNNQNADNIMAQSVPEKIKPDDGEKIKMSKKQIIGLVVLSLIAIGGVLFGVYGMNSQNEQIAELTVRATDAEGKVAELETDKVTITDPDGGTVEIADTVEVATENTQDYIYIGEWGIKIKVPEELVNNIGYLYSDSEIQILDSGESHTYYGPSVDYEQNSVLSIFRSEEGLTDFEGCVVSCTKYITTVDGYDYSYILQGSSLEQMNNTPLNEMKDGASFSKI